MVRVGTIQVHFHAAQVSVHLLEPESFSTPLRSSLQTCLQRLSCMLVIISAEFSEAYGTAFCYVESDPGFVTNYCPPNNKNTVSFQTCLKLRYQDFAPSHS